MPRLSGFHPREQPNWGHLSGPRAKSYLRWAGSKRWFAEKYGDDLRADIIQRKGRYFEPFLGAGAMALHLGLPNMMLGDAEQDLVWTHEQVKENPDAVCALLDLALYLWLPMIAVCYVCGARYAGLPLSPDHAPYDLMTAQTYEARSHNWHARHG